MAEALSTQEQLVRGSSRFVWFYQCFPDHVNSVCLGPYFFHLPPRFSVFLFVNIDVPVRDDW